MIRRTESGEYVVLIQPHRPDTGKHRNWVVIAVFNQDEGVLAYSLADAYISRGHAVSVAQIIAEDSVSLSFRENEER